MFGAYGSCNSNNQIQLNNMRQQGNNLQMQVKKVTTNKSACAYFVLCGLLKFQIKIYSHSSNDYKSISIRSSKIFDDDHFTYKITIRSKFLFPTQEKSFFIVEKQHDEVSFQNICWLTIYEQPPNSVNILDTTEFDLSLLFDVVPSIGASSTNFASLWDDDSLTDLELKGMDGSVHVHKIIMASHSPVIKTKLAGEWKDATASVVLVENTSKKTLKQLKEYMYLQRLPESGIKELAKVASFYMMSELLYGCTVKFLATLTAANASEYVELAMMYNMDILKFAIFHTIQRGLINVDDMIKEAQGSEGESRETVLGGTH